MSVNLDPKVKPEKNISTNILYKVDGTASKGVMVRTPKPSAIEIIVKIVRVLWASIRQK